MCYTLQKDSTMPSTLKSLTAEHTKRKLLKIKAAKVGSWPDAAPRSTFTHGILTVSLLCTSKQQVTCLVRYQKDKDSPWTKKK